MKRFCHIATMAAAMAFLGYSCGGNNANTSLTPSDQVQSDSTTAPSEDPMTDVVEEESFDDGDPNIKAASVDKMDMVVDGMGNVLGRLVKTNEDTYTVCSQDTYVVPQKGNSVVTYRARDGQGVVYTHRTHVNVRQEPDTQASVIGQITYVKDKVPETYPCLGKSKGWYKISVNGKVGYVRHDLAEWDGIDTF